MVKHGNFVEKSKFCQKIQMLPKDRNFAKKKKIFPKKSKFLTKPKSGYALVRPFLYFDHFHIFDPFCTSTHRRYFYLNFTSTFLSQLYFDLNLTSTFLSQLYFDQNCTSTCSSRPIRNTDLTKCRSTEFEVERSK